MKYSKIPAKFIRGGTSKGLFIESSFLPSNENDRDTILLKLMGSPDPTGLQINGMGGGITSTSKVALISKKYFNSIPYLSYTFGQVSVKESKIDWSGNCGNLASGLVEFVKHQKEYEDCIELVRDDKINLKEKIRVWQENKRHKMFIWGNLSNLSKECNTDSKISISGVEGLSDPIFVEFNNLTPEGSKLFPTGNLIDKISLDNCNIEATLINGTNPMIIIKPESVGLVGHEIPKYIAYEKIHPKINLILNESAKMMNIKVTESLRVAWVSSPIDYKDSMNNIITKDSVNILSRITAGNRVHHAHTGTGAINLSIAANIKGTIVSNAMHREGISNEVTIGHPSGRLTCESEVEFCNQTKLWKVNKAGFFRTSRLIIDGFVYI
jgi:2-methylaconitate isomerase